MSDLLSDRLKYYCDEYWYINEEIVDMAKRLEDSRDAAPQATIDISDDHTDIQDMVEELEKENAELKKALKHFIRISNNSEPIPPEFSELLNNKFWEKEE